MARSYSGPRFAVGNQVWRKRATHGRHTIFTDPEAMLESAYEYFAWCDENPYKKEDFIKGGENAGKVIELNQLRPYTLEGLCIFWGVTKKYLNDFVNTKTYAANADFSEVVGLIREIVDNQQYEGAAAGFLKEGIVRLKLGLAEKKEVLQNTNTVIDLSKLSDDALAELERAALDNIGAGPRGNTEA